MIQYSQCLIIILNMLVVTVRGGGVGAYIKANLKYNILNKQVCHSESLWLKVLHDNRPIIIGIIYRKPNTDISEFQESLIDVLHDCKIDSHDCILIYIYI